METEPEAHCIAEHLDTDAAVRTLLAERLERWRTERAIEQLQNGEVMFSRAAEMTGLSLWDFPDVIRETDALWVDGTEFDVS